MQAEHEAGENFRSYKMCIAKAEYNDLLKVGESYE